ncbi:aspartate, glycine, lysine and serine-rich protein-like [Papaver somniferum]|uniref:aspartate, glycine, lysine and serine-rich protein-like n=1 Tax=Papaver somniferum TaxID=3469 RepID=UPI000E6F5E37|nr:aspartate, glycine, lysine and serine-rich protein-like [Papaver somniferum]
MSQTQIHVSALLVLVLVGMISRQVTTSCGNPGTPLGAEKKTPPLALAPHPILAPPHPPMPPARPFGGHHLMNNGVASQPPVHNQTVTGNITVDGGGKSATSYYSYFANIQITAQGEGIGEGIWEVAGGIGEGIGEVAGGIGDGVGSAGSGISDGVGSAGYGVGKGIGSAVGGP